MTYAYGISAYGHFQKVKSMTLILVIWKVALLEA